MAEQKVLDIVPSDDPNQRLVIAVQRDAECSEQLVLRQETHSSVGWFVQSQIAIESGQLAGLRLILSSETIRRIGKAKRKMEQMPVVLPFCAGAAS